jgi:hypothetical protein
MGSKLSYIADYAEKFQYLQVAITPPFSFFQHNQQYDTLLPIPSPPARIN